MEDNKLKHSFVKQSNTTTDGFLERLRVLGRSAGIQPIHSNPTIVDYHTEITFTDELKRGVDETTIKRLLLNQLIEKLISENCVEFEQLTNHYDRTVKYKAKIKIQKI